MLKIQLLDTPEILGDWINELCQKNALQWESVTTHADLIIVGIESISCVDKGKMIMVVANKKELKQEIEHLCQLHLMAWLDITRLKASLNESFHLFLDYYYTNYHIGQLGQIDVFLDEVYYFEKKNYQSVKVATKRGDFFYQGSMHDLQRSLPKMFFHLDDQVSIHLDWIKKKDNGRINMPDGKSFSLNRALPERAPQKSQCLSDHLELGDNFSKQQIKTAKQKTITFLVLGWGLISLILIRLTPSIIVWLMTLLGYVGISFLLYRVLLLSTLNCTGNYFRLEKNGIAYCEPLTIQQRYSWIKALESGRQEDCLNFLENDDIRFIELCVRRSMNAASGIFGYINDRNYRFDLQIDTSQGMISLIDQIRLVHSQSDDSLRIACNWFYLLGVQLEGNQTYRLVLNDPNASLNQYIVSRKLKREND